MDGLEAVGSIGKYFEFLTECLDLIFYNSFVGLNILIHAQKRGANLDSAPI